MVRILSLQLASCTNILLIQQRYSQGNEGIDEQGVGGKSTRARGDQECERRPGMRAAVRRGRYEVGGGEGALDSARFRSMSVDTTSFCSNTIVSTKIKRSELKKMVRSADDEQEQI
jgi:hypothetical protein